MIQSSPLTGSSLGARINSALRFRGITQRELSRRVGLTEAAISRYVSGDRTPNAVHLAQIASALDVQYDQLLNGGPDFGRSEIEDALYLIRKNQPYLTNRDRLDFLMILCGLKTEADLDAEYGPAQERTE